MFIRAKHYVTEAKNVIFLLNLAEHDFPAKNLQLLTIANSFLLNIAENENFSANIYKNATYCKHFHNY